MIAPNSDALVLANVSILNIWITLALRRCVLRVAPHCFLCTERPSSALSAKVVRNVCWIVFRTYYLVRRSFFSVCPILFLFQGCDIYSNVEPFWFLVCASLSYRCLALPCGLNISQSYDSAVSRTETRQRSASHTHMLPPLLKILGFT